MTRIKGRADDDGEDDILIDMFALFAGCIGSICLLRVQLRIVYNHHYILEEIYC